MSDVVIAVPKTWASDAAKIDRTDVAAARPFKLVSPPEKVHALIFALLRDVRESEASLDEWRRIALSCSCEIVAMESPQELYLKSLELREAPGIEYELVRHSALQRILDVSFTASKLPQWKTSSSSALGKLLHQEYYKDIVVSGMSEPLTENGITTCIEVYTKLFVKHPSVVALLHKMDDMYGVGNPLDSTVKLNDLLTKVKNEVQGHMTPKISGDIGIWIHEMTVENWKGSFGLLLERFFKYVFGPDDAGVKKTEWLFEMLLDLFEGGALRKDELGRSALVGTAGSGGVGNRKGLADVIIFKFDLAKALIKWCQEQLQLDSAILEEMNAITKSVHDFRAKCGRCWGKKDEMVAMPWRALWPKGADKILGLIETAVFGVSQDEVILTHLRSRKPFQEFLTREPTSELLQQIYDERLEQNGNEANADAAELQPDDNEDEEMGDDEARLGHAQHLEM